MPKASQTLAKQFCKTLLQAFIDFARHLFSWQTLLDLSAPCLHSARGNAELLICGAKCKGAAEGRVLLLEINYLTMPWRSNLSGAGFAHTHRNWIKFESSGRWAVSKTCECSVCKQVKQALRFLHGAALPAGERIRGTATFPLDKFLPESCFVAHTKEVQQSHLTLWQDVTQPAQAHHCQLGIGSVSSACVSWQWTMFDASWLGLETWPSQSFCGWC